MCTMSLANVIPWAPASLVVGSPEAGQPESVKLTKPVWVLALSDVFQANQLSVCFSY